MYKITLFDACCSGIFSRTAQFYVDKLEDFESEWMQQSGVDEIRKERFLLSKAGEIVTDYYSPDPQFNIVQEDPNATCLWEKEYDFSDRTFALTSFLVQIPIGVHMKKAQIHLKYISFNGKKSLIGRYRIQIKDKKLMESRKRYPQGKVLYEGNPIFWCNEEEGILETYCYVEVWEDSELCEEDMGDIPEDIIRVLMRDVLGNSGGIYSPDYMI